MDICFYTSQINEEPGWPLSLPCVTSAWHSENRHMWSNYELNRNDRSLKAPVREAQGGKEESWIGGNHSLLVIHSLIIACLGCTHLASYSVHQRTHSEPEGTGYGSGYFW